VVGASGTIQHTPTGLYLYGGYGRQSTTRKSASVLLPRHRYHLVHPARYREEVVRPRQTTIYGEYRHDDTGSNLGAVTTKGDNGTFVQSGDIDFWARASSRASRRRT